MSLWTVIGAVPGSNGLRWWTWAHRRRWSEDEKLEIVLKSLQSPRQAAPTARRYGISRSLLLRWRRSFRPEPKDAAQPGFVPAIVVAESGPMPCPVPPASNGGSIEIEFAAGAQMRITGAVDKATLKAAVAALAHGRPW